MKDYENAKVEWIKAAQAYEKAQKKKRARLKRNKKPVAIVINGVPTSLF